MATVMKITATSITYPLQPKNLCGFFPYAFYHGRTFFIFPDFLKYVSKYILNHFPEHWVVKLTVKVKIDLLAIAV